MSGSGTSDGGLPPPPKPPRALSAAPPATPEQDQQGGRTLWQIYWDEDKDEPVVSMVDISKIELRPDSDFRPEVQMDERSGDMVIFERNADELEGRIKKGGSIFKKPFYKKKHRGIDLSQQEAMIPGARFNLLPRSGSDSDLDLIPPGRPGSRDCRARAWWCCVSCRTLEFWRHYWWIPATLLGALFIYVLITLIIVRSVLWSPT